MMKFEGNDTMPVELIDQNENLFDCFKGFVSDTNLFYNSRTLNMLQKMAYNDLGCRGNWNGGKEESDRFFC